MFEEDVEFHLDKDDSDDDFDDDEQDDFEVEKTLVNLVKKS